MKVKFGPAIILLITLLCSVLYLPRALAVDASLMISGNVAASTCIVDKDTQNVNIGTFSAKDFPSTGSVSDTQTFDIDLSECYDKLKNVQIKFSGTTDNDNPSLLALADSGSGKIMATGIGIELLDSNQKILPFNSTEPFTYDLSGASNKFIFFLRYKSTKDQVTSGEASAVMYFDLTYQ
ncbi:TPA: fimbrial protein [Citrobacter amalonaticus]|uniref:Fimbrial protein n=1 Tax=Citrobacter amalonaticus TaxID=35703 RepID=A0A9C7QLQ4_CITAM|nr:fimbrial protein [Citrobacter amalonaticus]